MSERKDGFRRAKSLHEGLSRRSGCHGIGRDEEGHEKQTRRLSDFPIVVDKWYVSMGFKREDRKQVEGMALGELEKVVKAGAVPRKMSRMQLDILSAVRLMKHVRRGYEDELKRTDAMLAVLDEANLKLASIKRKHSDSDIDEAIAALEAAEEALSRKQVAVKRFSALPRTKTAMDMLDQAKKLSGRERDMMVSRACAVFTSVRNRLGSWRDKDVAGLVEYNLQKECALRTERDRWIFSQLSRFAESPEYVFKFVTIDVSKLKVLDELERMLDSGAPAKEILRIMHAHSALFRVSRRERKKAEEKIALMERGAAPQDHVKTDFLIGHFAWLYRYVSKEQKAEAKAKIAHLRLFVNANKPRFMLDNLGKEPDGYLGPVLESLSAALELFEAPDLSAAKVRFAEARDRMKRFAYPSTS